MPLWWGHHHPLVFCTHLFCQARGIADFLKQKPKQEPGRKGDGNNSKEKQTVFKFWGGGGFWFFFFFWLVGFFKISSRYLHFHAIPQWVPLFHRRFTELRALAAASLNATSRSTHISHCKAGADKRTWHCLLTPTYTLSFCSLSHTHTRSSWHQHIHSSAQHWWAFIQAPVTWSRALCHHSKFILHVFHLLELALLIALPPPFLIPEQYLTGLQYPSRPINYNLANKKQPFLKLLFLFKTRTSYNISSATTVYTLFVFYLHPFT